jgi:hypothetical protein
VNENDKPVNPHHQCTVEEMMKGVQIWDKDGNPKWVGEWIPDATAQEVEDALPEVDEEVEADFEKWRRAFADPDNIQIICVGIAKGPQTTPNPE